MSTTIIRTARKKQYQIVPQSLIEDIRLTWAARGLLIYLISKPDDWTVDVRHLIKQAPSGRDKVYTMLKKLIHHGYVKRVKKRDSEGRIRGVIYYVYDEPNEPHPENPDTALPEPETQEALPTTEYVCSSNTTTYTNTVGKSQDSAQVMPPSLSDKERKDAAEMVSELPAQRQQELLDELAGIIKAKKLRNVPLACLRGMANKERIGEFNPSLGIRIAESRDRQQERDTRPHSPPAELEQIPKHWENDALYKKLQKMGGSIKTDSE